MPGVVNSPVRAFKAIEGDPFAVGGAKGSKMRDRVGNEYINYVNAFGAIILGHTHDELVLAFTGREKFIMCDDNYHGHCDYFLVKPVGRPNSAGVPKCVTLLTLTCPYNDISAVKNLFESNKGEIAAVILEPVVGNSGFISLKPRFLEELRRITNENDSLLIFDEVMTGFRVSYGGAQELFSFWTKDFF